MIWYDIHTCASIKVNLKNIFPHNNPPPNFTEINKTLYHLCRNTTIHSYNKPYILLKLEISKAHRIPHTISWTWVLINWYTLYFNFLINKVNIVIQNKFNVNDIHYKRTHRNNSEPLFSILVYEIKTPIHIYKSQLLLVLTNVN